VQAEARMIKPIPICFYSAPMTWYDENIFLDMNDLDMILRENCHATSALASWGLTWLATLNVQ
jgi:hypothetical protein